jgi:16S rRNA (cytosine1402-N4)-methyltransferase
MSTSVVRQAGGGLHVPVLREQIEKTLVPSSGKMESFVDATIGAGGHSASLLRTHSHSLRLLVGLDRDASALTHARHALAQERAHLPNTRAAHATLQFVHCDFRHALSSSSTHC